MDGLKSQLDFNHLTIHQQQQNIQSTRTCRTTCTCAYVPSHFVTLDVSCHRPHLSDFQRVTVLRVAGVHETLRAWHPNRVPTSCRHHKGHEAQVAEAGQLEAVERQHQGVAEINFEQKRSLD